MTGKDQNIVYYNIDEETGKGVYERGNEAVIMSPRFAAQLSKHTGQLSGSSSIPMSDIEWETLKALCRGGRDD